MHAKVRTLRWVSVSACAVSCLTLSSAGAWAGDLTPVQAACSASSTVCSVRVSKLSEPHAQSPTVQGIADVPLPAQLALQRWLASCRVNFPPAAAGAQAHPPGPGSWYLAACAHLLGLKDQVPAGMPLMWVPGARAASALQAALTAEAHLRLPKPTVMSSPGPAAQVPKVVNLPTWAWVPAADFAAVSATARLPGVSATVTASPYAVDWVWGDGSRSHCTGPGTPYVPGANDPARPSPDCDHIYRTTSAEAPGERFAVSATVDWRVRWSGAGETGTLPDLKASASEVWPVEQIQSVIVN